MMLSKSEWRISLSRKRENLTQTQIGEKSLQIANQLNSLDIWSGHNYHLFLSIQRKHEIDTEPILSLLQGRDKNVVISKSDFKSKQMRHFLLTENTVITPNRYGIPEPDDNGIQIHPEQLDVVFVPLLGSDFYGNRLGYGGGFYDRFLAKCQPDCLKIGLDFFPPLDTTLPSEPTDAGLDMLVYPHGKFVF